MPHKIYLSLAFHNHQPVGNFGWVFQEAFDKAYLPMVECIERHPTIRLALHYTGPLRDWLIGNQPDFLPRLRSLVERQQVEILTGSYYEAVLTSLPDADKLGQIAKLTRAIQEDFGHDAAGLWLAERIWEPHLPQSLAASGVQYTIVDDAHFKAIGYGDDDLFGYYVTEEQGSILKVYATSMWLRYGIPWKPVNEVIDWLREQGSVPDPSGRYVGRVKVAVMGDDGEKFGLWPGTYDHVWKNGWMDQFFAALEDQADWIETIPPGEFAGQYPSLGRIYLPTCSYDEMGEWSLPPDAAWELPHLRDELVREGRGSVTKYLHGGLWRSFMVKYPEVNQLHKKALWVSRKVHGMADSPAKLRALDHLWAGQCNCGYWHGVFGGVYLFHIREADYRHLISAENIADDLERDPSRVSFARVDVVDFDLDSLDDVVVSTDRQSLTFDLDQGGAVVEWDYRPLAYNLLNVLGRRREGYHKTLVDAAAAGVVVTPGNTAQGGETETIHTKTVRAKEPNLHEKLFYDWHRRATLIDHFVGSNVTLDDFYRSQYDEAGDFVNQSYTAEIIHSDNQDVSVILRRQGQVRQGELAVPVTVEKQVTLSPSNDSMGVTYRVVNGGAGDLKVRFGVETNWGFAGGNDAHTYLETGGGRFSLGEISASDDIDAWHIVSELWKITVRLEVERSATLWRFPLETISASEQGFERNYQGTTMVLWWPLSLGHEQEWRMDMNISLGSI